VTGPPIRIVLLRPLVLSTLVLMLCRDATSAQTLSSTRRHSMGDPAEHISLHSLQTNPAPASTATVAATIVVANTALPTATQTPAPTTTPVGSSPAASRLLTAARAALKTANTSHFSVIEKVNLGGLVKGTIRQQGDMSQRPSEVTAHITGSLSALGKPQKIDEHHVQIGTKAWVKSAQTHGVWKMEKATPPTASGAIQNPLDLAKGNGVKIKNLQTVDAEVFGSVAVWHIHGTVTAPVTQTTTATGTVDYLIAKAGNLPYRIQENVNDPKDSLLLNLRATLSAFGKKVSIATPKVGSTLR
jgi:hypothetical protein